MIASEPAASPAIVTRPTTAGEFRTAAASLCVSYLRQPPNDEQWAKSVPSWENMISFSSWDGRQCVGHGGYHVADTNVPGGSRLGTAAITRVGVIPTHSRLGAGTALMEALIDHARDNELPLASLRASEAVIYRRHGFGLAGEFANVTIDPARARPVAGTAPGRFRLLAPDEIEPATTEIDNRALGSRPGLMTRVDTWRRRHFDDAIEQNKGAFVVAHLDADGQPDGYVHYHTTWNDVFDRAGDGQVRDVMAVSDDVELALWAYLFDVDLVRKWESAERPVDDLIREAITDRRAYQVRAINDEQWLRLLDVDVALSARRFNPVSGSVVVEVSDPLIIGNNGRWRIGAQGAERCEDEPDLEAGIDALSALYLGAGSWLTEAAVGRVQVAQAGVDKAAVLGLADQLFSHKPLPFCGTFF